MTLKIKLHWDPNCPSTVYEQEFRPFKGDANGSSADKYLNKHCFLKNYTKYGPLDTLTQKFTGVEQILA